MDMQLRDDGLQGARRFYLQPETSLRYHGLFDGPMPNFSFI